MCHIRVTSFVSLAPVLVASVFDDIVLTLVVSDDVFSSYWLTCVVVCAVLTTVLSVLFSGNRYWRWKRVANKILLVSLYLPAVTLWSSVHFYESERWTMSCRIKEPLCLCYIISTHFITARKRIFVHLWVKNQFLLFEENGLMGRQDIECWGARSWLPCYHVTEEANYCYAAIS